MGVSMLCGMIVGAIIFCAGAFVGAVMVGVGANIEKVKITKNHAAEK